MIEAKDMRVNKVKKIKDVEDILEKNFLLAAKDEYFCKLCNSLDMDKKQLKKYTTKLESSVRELKNCKGCKGLECCKNEVNGYIYYPIKKNDYLVFSYEACKYKKEEEENSGGVIYYETSKAIRDARMKDIYLDEASRVEVMKYIKSFIKNYPNSKGIYLHGSFGSGKSYILNALLNELGKRKEKCVSIYYPKLLKNLKSSFNSKAGDYDIIYNELETCDVLLIDDIGAENNTAWARDEVLGILLQSRMDNKKLTFFTSNMTLEELEEHLSYTNDRCERVKARRIIERIKELAKPIELVGENKRDK